MALTESAQCLDVVAEVSAVLRTGKTHRYFAHDAVHAQLLISVFRTLNFLVFIFRPEDIFPLGGVDEVVLGEGPPGRVAAVATLITVEHLTLLAHCRSIRRSVLAQFTLDFVMLVLVIVLIHDRFQDFVRGQGLGPGVIEKHGLVTHGTLNSERARLQRLREDVGDAGGADVARRATVADDAAVGFGNYAQFVYLREVDGFVDHLCPLVPSPRGLGDQLLRGLLDPDSACHTERVVTGKQHWFCVHLATDRAL